MITESISLSIGTPLLDAKILIVDDEKANVRLLEVMLEQAGFTNVSSTTDPREAGPLVRQWRPDLLLLDLNMPHFNGFEVLRQLKEEREQHSMPVLVLTADATSPVKHRALTEGANDFVTKPLDQVEVLLRIGNLLQGHLHSTLLEAKVRERTLAFEIAQLETVQRLALAAEFRDDQTGLHTQRVGLLSGDIAVAMGLEPSFAELIRQAAPLHDVGKIGISDTILLKPGPLTPEEFAIMKQHTKIGARIMAGSSSPILQLAEEIALTHHERWDGTGYAGLAGDAIPLSGRIVAVADVLDALLHARPYKPAWPLEDAVAEIRRQSGRQFDPRVVEAFLTLNISAFYGEDSAF
jgi:putative two-component system response regulator